MLADEDKTNSFNVYKYKTGLPDNKIKSMMISKNYTVEAYSWKAFEGRNKSFHNIDDEPKCIDVADTDKLLAKSISSIKFYYLDF